MIHREFEEQQKEIKLFQVGDYDWIAAKNPTDAKLVMAGLLGEDLEGYEIHYGSEDCKELTDAQMNYLRFRDFGETDPYTQTFRQKLDELILAKTQFPVHFASSEY